MSEIKLSVIPDVVSDYLTPTSTIAICFGTQLLIVFVTVSLYKGRAKTLWLSDATNVFLNGGGVIAGLKVVSMSIENKIPTIADDNKLYICLGGIVLIWVSTAEIIKKIK